MNGEIRFDIFIFSITVDKERVREFWEVVKRKWQIKNMEDFQKITNFGKLERETRKS